MLTCDIETLLYHILIIKFVADVIVEFGYD